MGNTNKTYVKNCGYENIYNFTLIFLFCFIWTSIPQYCIQKDCEMLHRVLLTIEYVLSGSVVECSRSMIGSSSLIGGTVLCMTLHLPLSTCITEICWLWHKASTQKKCNKRTYYEPLHEISNNVVCATSKGSDQPAHTRRLIRAFATRLNIPWFLGYWPTIIWSF